MALAKFRDALLTFVRALDVVHDHWINPSSNVTKCNAAISAHNHAAVARDTIEELSKKIVIDVVAPRGMDPVQFVASILDDVENVWHLCRFVYSIEADLPEANADLERIRNEMHSRLPSLRNQLWESSRHIGHAIELQEAAAEVKKRLQTPTKDEDVLPKKNRANSPSREKAAAAYRYAMERYKHAQDMTIDELHEAIKKDDEVAQLIPSNPESFGKYLRDYGIKRYSSGRKATGGSVVSRSDLD